MKKDDPFYDPDDGILARMTQEIRSLLTEHIADENSGEIDKDPARVPTSREIHLHSEPLRPLRLLRGAKPTPKIET